MRSLGDFLLLMKRDLSSAMMKARKYEGRGEELRVRSLNYVRERSDVCGVGERKD